MALPLEGQYGEQTQSNAMDSFNTPDLAPFGTPCYFMTTRPLSYGYTWQFPDYTSSNTLCTMPSDGIFAPKEPFRPYDHRFGKAAVVCRVILAMVR
ncbi:hypothetical protein KCU85_g8493, partial [Aureobasidium melanogenum]